MGYFVPFIKSLRIGQVWRHRSGPGRKVEVLEINGTKIKLKLLCHGKTAQAFNKRKEYELDFEELIRSYRPVEFDDRP